MTTSVLRPALGTSPRSSLAHSVQTGGTADAGRGTTVRRVHEMARLLSFAPRGRATKDDVLCGFRQTEFLDGVRKRTESEDGCGTPDGPARVVEP
jgi:hypothetical protein